jgi:hypothetical protein
VAVAVDVVSSVSCVSDIVGVSTMVKKRPGMPTFVIFGHNEELP